MWFPWCVSHRDRMAAVERQKAGWRSEKKAGLHWNGVRLQICKAKNWLWAVWESRQGDCSATCPGQNILQRVSRNSSQSEGNSSCRPRTIRRHLSTNKNRKPTSFQVTGGQWLTHDITVLINEVTIMLKLKGDSQGLNLKKMTRQIRPTRQA